MRLFLSTIRVLVVGALALAVSLLLVYVVGELLLVWYMWRSDLSARAELSEDYGFAMLYVAVGVVAFAVAFPTTFYFLQRFSERLLVTL
ncbi:MAG: hypothetical protein KJ634_11510 [Gammaproteobacteria bacterium]|nr:hypothetical protein [Gammaproteobacteria bacterium]MBU1416242.1 hypothetical protein [Gammaproteobacteria bacterium]